MSALAEILPASGLERQLYSPIRDFVERPSKGLRPALCIATCRAHRGRTANALTSAAGIELLHNAFLVHDDIEDGSEYRRGRPTLHRSLGTPLALNIGDAMNALSMRLFRRNIESLGPAAALRIFDEVDHMLLESLEGQALELGWVRENDCALAIDDYLRMILKKTSWYSFIHPMRIGAIAADPEDTELDRFNLFGSLLGAAFQVQDDILNLTGDPERYGKEIGGDLWEGKRTLPLGHALRHAGPPDRAHLVDFLRRGRDGRLPREVHLVHRLLEELGSIDWTRQVARALAAAAEESFESAFAGAVAGPDRDFVESLVSYLVERDI